MDMMDSLSYELYLAEQELQDNLAVYQIKLQGPLNEQTLVAISESVKDTVMTYIRKVIASIQKAWNSFKTTIADKTANILYDKNRQYFESGFVMNPAKDFELPDLDKFKSFINQAHIPAYSSSMSDSLGNSDDFFKKYLPKYTQEGKKIDEIAKAEIFTKCTGEEKLDSKIMTEFAKFVTSEYKSIMDILSQNIKDINSSSRTIESAISVSNKSESFSYDDTLRYYFNEADEEKTTPPAGNGGATPDKDNSKEGFKSAVPNDPAKLNDEKKDAAADLTKQINVYFKCATTLLSAKMSVSNSVFSKSITLMNQYINLQKKQAKISKSEDKKAGADNTSTSTTIKL